MGENSLQGREGGGWGLRIFPHKPPAPHIHTSHTSHTCCISPGEVASDCNSYDRCCSSTLWLVEQLATSAAASGVRGKPD